MTCQMCPQPGGALLIIKRRDGGTPEALGIYCSHDCLIADVQQNWEAGRG